MAKKPRDQGLVWFFFLYIILLVRNERSPPDKCALASSERKWSEAFTACAYRRDPVSAIRQARAVFYLEDYDRASTLAVPLLKSELRSDAHSLLGSIALARGQGSLARSYLVLAEIEHLTKLDVGNAARDAHQLAGAYRLDGAYQASLDAIDRARLYSIFDRRMDSLLALARANILRNLGNLREAQNMLELAMSAVVDSADQAFLNLEQSILYLDYRDFGLARSILKKTLDSERSQPTPRDSVIQAALLNLAYVDRNTERLSEADFEVEESRAAHIDQMSYKLNIGIIRFEQRQFYIAESDLAEADNLNRDALYWWVIPYYRARTAEALNKSHDAESLYRISIDRMRRLALQIGPVGASLIATNRDPFERLIGLLARQDRWPEALEVVAAMDSADVLSDVRSQLPPTVPSFNITPSILDRELFKVNATEVSRAWSGKQLEVIVADGQESVWRIEVDRGVISGSKVGILSNVLGLANKLEDDPDNHAIATELGSVFLPHSRNGSEPVVVLAVGSLAAAPIWALRLDGDLALEKFALARATRLAPTSAHAFSPTYSVIGDSQGDLLYARNELAMVARHFGIAPLIGPAATRASIRHAAGGEWLHLSVHASAGGIELADGPLLSAEIPELGSPRIVVLAACSSATGAEPMGTGSLADAFISAGAEMVVATTRSVDDSLAQQFMDRFYNHLKLLPPLESFAAAQRDVHKLAESSNFSAWASFELRLGRPVRL